MIVPTTFKLLHESCIILARNSKCIHTVLQHKLVRTYLCFVFQFKLNKWIVSILAFSFRFLVDLYSDRNIILLSSSMKCEACLVKHNSMYETDQKTRVAFSVEN